jgi:hypothetical protein
METVAKFICNLSDREVSRLPKLRLLTVQQWISQNIVLNDSQLNHEIDDVDNINISINNSNDDISIDEPEIRTSNVLTTTVASGTNVTSSLINTNISVLKNTNISSSSSSSSSCCINLPNNDQSVECNNVDINITNENQLIPILNIRSLREKSKATDTLQNAHKIQKRHSKINFPSPEEFGLNIQPVFIEKTSKHLLWNDATQFIQIDRGFKLLYAIGDREWFFQLEYNSVRVSNEVIGSVEASILSIVTFEMRKVKYYGIMLQALILFLKSGIDVVKKYNFRYFKLVPYIGKDYQGLNTYYKFLYRAEYFDYRDKEYIYLL